MLMKLTSWCSWCWCGTCRCCSCWCCRCWCGTCWCGTCWCCSCWCWWYRGCVATLESLRGWYFIVLTAPRLNPSRSARHIPTCRRHGVVYARHISSRRRHVVAPAGHTPTRRRHGQHGLACAGHRQTKTSRLNFLLVRDNVNDSNMMIWHWSVPYTF